MEKVRLDTSAQARLWGPDKDNGGQASRLGGEHVPRKKGKGIVVAATARIRMPFLDT